MESSVSTQRRRVRLNPEVEVMNDGICREAIECLDGIFMDCKKNHKKFIRRDQFVITDLPEEIRHETVLKLIYHNADLVVRVIREERSRSSPKQTGSGSVCYFSDTFDLFDCTHGRDLKNCNQCHIPNCPYTKIFGEDHYLITNFVPNLTEEQLKRSHIGFRVSTNLHVVGSCHEAANTKIEFFFDSPEVKGKKGVDSQKIVAQGVCLCAQWDEQDKVHIVCVADRSDRLQHLLSTMREVFWEHFNAMPADIKQKLCEEYVILISHPHGCSKSISIGRNEGCHDVVVNPTTRYVETRYNAESCKGSSGGVVLGPGWMNGGPAYRVHCGTDEDTGHKVSKSFWVTKGVGKEVHKDNRENYYHQSCSVMQEEECFFCKKEPPCCPTQSHKARASAV